MNHLFCLTYINNTVKGEANRATKGSWKEGSVGGVKNKNQKNLPLAVVVVLRAHTFRGKPPCHGDG